MHIDLLKAVENEQYSIEGSIKGDNTLFEYRNLKFDGDINFKGSYILRKGDLSVIGELTAKLDAQCDRCLKDVEINIKLPFNETFHANADKGEYAIENNKAVLDEAAYQNILLNIPSKILCKEDCKGICALCGCDLNNHDCDCRSDSDDNNPFAILKNIVGGAKNGGTQK